MGSDGLLYTVRDQQLRFNAWSKMNDPRESREWRSTGTLVATGNYSDSHMARRIDDVLRRSARLLSLTADREPVPEAKPVHLFHRGWGRAALWAHYAEQHHGVCLVLDSEAIGATLADLPFKDGRYTTWGRISLDPPPRFLSGADGV